MSLNSRLRRIEEQLNSRQREELLVVLVRGGSSVPGAHIGGVRIVPNDGECEEEFIERAKREAIAARQSFVAIAGLEAKTQRAFKPYFTKPNSNL
jgi:hypothetical protein